MTFRFGNDVTLETRSLAILPVGKCRSQWSIACVRGTWGSAAPAVGRIFKRPRLNSGEKQTPAAFAFTLDKFWATGTQDPG